GPDLPDGAERGQPFTVTLDALQTLLLVAPSKADDVFEDLSGSQVLSSKPIAVYAGHVCAAYGTNASACNHLVEQMPPVSSFGTHFVTAPFRTFDGRGPGGPTAQYGDFVRVMAGQDETEVQVDGQI